MTASIPSSTADVVVVGSGAAALSAAISAAVHGASVKLIEKAPQLGGTTAWSGGVMWIPANSRMLEAGMDDTPAEALEYLVSLGEGRFPDPELVETVVQNGREAIDFLEAHSPLVTQMAQNMNTEYYADRPGFKKFGRAILASGIDAKHVLGDWWDKVRDSEHIPPVDNPELRELWGEQGPGADAPNWGEIFAERLEQGRRFGGPALITALTKGALDAGVEIVLNAPAERLVVEDGRVVGVVATVDGEEHVTYATKAVVLGTGGFEWNNELVLAFLGMTDVLPMSPSTNVGDGLIMGIEAGAALGNMTNALGLPGFWDGERTVDGRPFGSPGSPRMDSGAILVNKFGKRFVNEGISYMDMPKVLRAFDYESASYPNSTPVWAVLDQHGRERSPDVPDGDAPNWIKVAETIEELGEAIGVDPATLRAEVDRWNAHVDVGVDPDFHRGEIWFEGFYQPGDPDPRLKGMEKIEVGPFYGVPMYNGISSTMGGLRIDADARVLALRGGVIDGLYAVGNVTANVLGQTFPGPGGAIGPGVTLGYLAGRHAAGGVPSAG